MLHDTRRTVRRDVGNGDPALARGIQIDRVDSGRQRTHTTKPWQLRECFSPEPGFVDQDEVGLARPLDDLAVARTIVDRKLTELRQRRPRIVTRICGVTVEYYDFGHGAPIVLSPRFADRCSAQKLLKRFSIGWRGRLFVAVHFADAVREQAG